MPKQRRLRARVTHQHAAESSLKLEGLLFHLHLWARHYIDKSKSKNASYRMWKKQLNRSFARTFAKRHVDPNDCAELATIGIYNTSNGEYEKAIPFLRRSCAIFPNSIVELALSECLCRADAPRNALQILERLFHRTKWKDITRFFDSCCVGPFESDFNQTARQLICNCYTQLLSLEIKPKWIAKLDRHETSLYRDGVYDEWEPAEIKDRLAHLVQCKFWRNRYMDAVPYVHKIYELCVEYDLLLSAHQAMQCYLVLFFVGAYDPYQLLVSHQLVNSVEALHKITIADKHCDQDHSRADVLMHKAFVVFIQSMLGCSMFEFEKDLNETLIQALIRGKSVFHCCLRKDGIQSKEPTYEIDSIIALFYSRLGDLKKANHYFAGPVLVAIDTMIRRRRHNRKSRNSRSHMPLCIVMGLWLLFFLFAYHLETRLLNYKMACYFYRIALNQKPGDAYTSYRYGILLSRMGKYRMSHKHLDIAKRCNGSWPLPIASTDNSRCTLYDECSHCGAKGHNFKKCNRCRVVFYCSRACQKYDWTLGSNGHKHRCAPKDRLSVCDKVRPFVLKLKNL